MIIDTIYCVKHSSMHFKWIISFKIMGIIILFFPPTGEEIDIQKSKLILDDQDGKWSSWDLNPGLLVPNSSFCPYDSLWICNSS